ncbi:hypothetical protein [Pseudohaliea sp.]|uniref:hypothetical protein n=1 Tax=Pseudohaliea sp. TaxID=2740289 RepID=UPI0032EFFCDF
MRYLLLPLAGFFFSLTAGHSLAQGRAPTCDDLAWSAAALAANPDVGLLCQGVYVKGDTYYAKATIRITRVDGLRVTFVPYRRDGSLGKARNVSLGRDWKVMINGEALTASNLVKGQELTVFIPQDRFAISIGGPDAGELLPIE